MMNDLTVEGLAQILKDLETLEYRVSVQEQEVARLTIENRNLKAQLWKSQTQARILQERLGKAQGLLKRIQKENTSGVSTNISNEIARMIRKVVDTEAPEPHSRTEPRKFGHTYPMKVASHD